MYRYPTDMENKNQKPEIKRKMVMKLIKRVNISKKRIKKGLLPLDYENQGWRIVFPKSPEFYDFLPAGRKLMEMSIYDYDMGGGYYWILLSEPPKGIMTPAMRLMQL